MPGPVLGAGTVNFHLVNKFMLSPSYKPSTVLGTEDNNRRNNDSLN